MGYNLIDSDTRRCDVHLPEYVCQNIINNPDVKDFFVLNFDTMKQISFTKIQKSLVLSHF